MPSTRRMQLTYGAVQATDCDVPRGTHSLQLPPLCITSDSCMSHFCVSHMTFTVHPCQARRRGAAAAEVSLRVCAGLTRQQSPWVLAPVAWDADSERAAAIWLARKLGRALLRLTDGDYRANSLRVGALSNMEGVQEKSWIMRAPRCRTCKVHRSTARRRPAGGLWPGLRSCAMPARLSSGASCYHRVL